MKSLLPRSLLRLFIETMYEMYPIRTTELYRNTPRQLLMAVMMSAQTTDRQVNVVNQHLRISVQTPHDIVALWLPALQIALQSIGLWKSKAQHIFDTSHLLTAGQISPIYHIPDTLEALMQLPGVGEKTAKVILSVLYGQHYIAADTHVHRVANRLGMVATTNPIYTSRQLEAIIPKDLIDLTHHSMIYFGRYHCTARSPKCSTCPLSLHCRYHRLSSNS